MGFTLSVGFDRADGVTLLPVQPTGSGGAASTLGTATPVGSIFILSNNDASQITQELADSPEIERAEQATFSHTFRTSWANCLTLIPMLGRGVFVTDSFGNIWRILSAKIQHDRGTWGKLTIVAESISFDSPPDEYDITPVELGINIIKHPRYFWALNPSVSNPIDGSDDYTTIANPGDPVGNQATVAQVKASVIRAIQTYTDSPLQPTANNLNGTISTNVVLQIADNKTQIGTNPTYISYAGNTVCLFAAAAAGEIIQKLWKNIDTPYLPGWQVEWTQYFFAPVFLNPGAFIQNPVGIVPAFFFSPSQDGSNTIFDQFAQINPQCFSTNGHTTGEPQISWLRKADQQQYQRTWLRVTYTWIGSPIGNWDTEIFSANGRPDGTPTDETGVNGFIPIPPA